MSRTKRSTKLSSREARSKLEKGKRYQEPLAEGRYLAYRRPMNNQAGSWLARWTDLDTGKSIQHRLGDADDLMEPDGVGILDFSTAQKQAEAWFKERNNRAQIEATGVPIATGPYTVANAAADYLRDAERRGVKGHNIMTITFNAHILPELKDISLAKLTKHRIETWLQALAESPRRRTGKARTEVEHLEAPTSDEERRLGSTRKTLWHGGHMTRKSLCRKHARRPRSIHSVSMNSVTPIASGLVNAGVPLAYVAAQLGHVDTSMVERHYGHLSPSALAQSIRKLSPILKISKVKVQPLQIRKQA